MVLLRECLPLAMIGLIAGGMFLDADEAAAGRMRKARRAQLDARSLLVNPAALQESPPTAPPANGALPNGALPNGALPNGALPNGAVPAPVGPAMVLPGPVLPGTPGLHPAGPGVAPQFHFDPSAFPGGIGQLDPCQRIPTTLTICDPCTGCQRTVEVCLPAQCLSEQPCVTFRDPLIGVGLWNFTWQCCDFEVRVRAFRNGRLAVRD